MPVSKRLRFEILRRDNHTCRYCGRSAPEAKLTVDHVVPETLGGTDDPKNLVAACSDCNGGKSSVPADAPLVNDVASDAIRWAQAMQQASDELIEREDELEAICQAVHQVWKPRWIPSDYRSSIYAFVKAGLTEAHLVDLAHVALSARGVGDRWSYFCGCCWKRIKQLQERASVLVKNDGQQTADETRLITRWTVDEIREYIKEAHAYANRWLSQEQIDVVHCKHNSFDHCGDPVCVVEHATALFWLAFKQQGTDCEESVRDEEVMDEADRLEELVNG